MITDLYTVITLFFTKSTGCAVTVYGSHAVTGCSVQQRAIVSTIGIVWYMGGLSLFM